jgi:uncharacterized alpha-E superfamily protein
MPICLLNIQTKRAADAAQWQSMFGMCEASNSFLKHQNKQTNKQNVK